MEDAFHFMEAIRSYPFEECGENLCSLTDAAEGVEVAFSQTLRNGQFPREFFIRVGLAEPFREAARAMNDRGWMLKIEDAYRSPEMQRAQSHNPAFFDRILEMVIWELGGEIPTPELMLRRVSALIATRCRVGTHVSGSAIDVTLWSLTTGEELKRGGAYPEFSEKSPMASPFITREERQNRQEIDAVMKHYGWIAYPYEFWHYSIGDAYAEYLGGMGRPARYGAIRFEEGKIKPVPDSESDELLEPLEFYQQSIQEALARREKLGGRDLNL